MAVLVIRALMVSCLERAHLLVVHALERVWCLSRLLQLALSNRLGGRCLLRLEIAISLARGHLGGNLSFLHGDYFGYKGLPAGLLALG